MDVIYPKNNAKIFIPRDLDGTTEKTIFEIAHRTNNIIVFWHLDNQFIGSTKNIHKMEIITSFGKYKMTLVDENGETITWNFEVLEK
jgi:penicillin-binding protein 1C